MTAFSCCLLLLGACTNPFSEEDGVQRGTIGYVQGDLGVVSVEEPQAALIARDILSAGGSAADAATAIGLTLTVTMPAAASIGGGGVCIAREHDFGDTQPPKVIDFLPRSPSSIPPGTERPSAVPGMARGLFLLHSMYGSLKWESLIAPAENLARFGFQVPRALATEISSVASALVRDPQSRRVFVRKDGNVIKEGDLLQQAELAATLGRLRSNGVGDFYSGVSARNFVDAVRSAGGFLTVEDLRGYQPVVREPISFEWENGTVWHFAGPPAAGGAVASEMMALLMTDGRFELADEDLREHLLVETAKRAFVDRMKYMQADGTYREDAQSLIAADRRENLGDGIDDDRATPLNSLIATPTDWPETPAAVSFAVMDARGGAVACTLTMNNIFGTGRMAPGFGAVLAAAPDQRGRTFTPLGPALLTSEFSNRAYMAAAASGGVTAPTALVNVIARAAAGPQTLKESMVAPRIHYAGVPDKVFVEAEMPESVLASLRQRGHEVALTRSIGRVAAVFCRTGVPSRRQIECASAADPRGYGIAIGGN